MMNDEWGVSSKLMARFGLRIHHSAFITQHFRIRTPHPFLRNHVQERVFCLGKSQEFKR